MKKITNLKSKNFRSIIYLSIISMLSNFQVFSSQELEEVNNVNLKAKITDTDFINQAKEKHTLIKAERTKLEHKYKALEQLVHEPEVQYYVNLTIKDLKPKLVKLASDNFIEENINVPSKEVKKIKEGYKESLSSKDEEKLNVFSPTRHAHWPGSRERKNTINGLQNDDISVQHRLTNSCNLQRMNTQKNDIKSFSDDVRFKKKQLKSLVDVKDTKKELKELKQIVAQMQRNNTNVSDSFICPITHELYQDPIITRCGHTFEHLPLISWLSQHPTCPTCRKDVNENDLSPNIILRNATQQFGNRPKKVMNNFNSVESKEEKKDAEEE